MKKLNLFIIVLAGLFIFTSCEDNLGPELSSNPQEPTFTNAPSGDAFVLTEADSLETALDLEWSRPGLGFRAAANYTVEMGEAGTDFADPLILAETTETSFIMTVAELNSIVFGAGYEANSEVDFEIRVITEINDDVEEMVSSPFTISVTPYFIDTGLPEFMNLYLVGDATAAGWDNNNNNMPMVRLPESEENNYSFTGLFSGGVEFKLLETPGEWQPQWGNDGGDLASNEDLGGDPPAFSIVDGDGYYTLEVDIEARTFTLETYDESSAPDYTTIGLIGDSTPGGWDADTDMTQSSFDPHIWYLNDVELEFGVAKFRADDDWAVNWGSDTEFSGFGVQDGSDIPVSPGTYNIWFNDLTGGYMFIPVE